MPKLSQGKSKAGLMSTFRLVMEIVRTTIPMAILVLQVLIYYQ